jgi:hypothetical protein
MKVIKPQIGASQALKTANKKSQDARPVILLFLYLSIIIFVHTRLERAIKTKKRNEQI